MYLYLLSQRRKKGLFITLIQNHIPFVFYIICRVENIKVFRHTCVHIPSNTNNNNEQSTQRDFDTQRNI